MARLNAKRRRALAEHKERIAQSAILNPSMVSSVGFLRSSTAQKPLEIVARKAFYQRKVDKGTSGVKPERITLPEHVKDPIVSPRPSSPPVRRLARPDKVQPIGHKTWSGKPTTVEFEARHKLPPGIWGEKIDNG